MCAVCRYSIHLHLCGDQEGWTAVHKNLIMNSKQRCVVVHATFNARIEGNVAYNTTGQRLYSTVLYSTVLYCTVPFLVAALTFMRTVLA